MTTYKNLSGESGVTSYKLFDDAIYVQFQNGCIYRYSHLKAGASHVRNMKELAERGVGLNGYINLNVKYLYD